MECLSTLYIDKPMKAPTLMQAIARSNRVYAPGTAREEAERAFANVFRIAEAAGFKRTDIVYVDLAFIALGNIVQTANKA